LLSSVAADIGYENIEGRLKGVKQTILD